MALKTIIKVLGIDFETASPKRNSACSVGLYLKEFGTDCVLYENEILINPFCDFCYFNMMVNGITPEMVVDSPSFDEVYKQIGELIDDDTVLIAHNASFDVSVLRKSCDAYQLEYPCCSYVCTLLLSRALIPNMASYSLPHVVDYLGLEPFDHHNALADAKACVSVFENLMKTCEAVTLEQLARRSGIRYGRLQEDRYWACRRSKESSYQVDPEICNSEEVCFTNDEIEINEDNPFFRKTVVFTGIINGMPRKQAENIIEKYGGFNGKGITKKTNYLVYGYQDSISLRGQAKSSKMQKAEQYAAAGNDIQIICESDFFRMIEIDSYTDGSTSTNEKVSD